MIKEDVMKKICYLVTIPSTIRAFFIPQLKYLADNGFDVSVICSNDDCLQEELGEKIHYLPIEIPRGISVKASVSAVGKLIKLFKKEKFDIVQYSTPNAALYASVAAKIVGVKVRNYHLMGYRYLGAQGASRSILKIIEKVTCMLSTNIECVSKSNMKLGIKEKLFVESKATVVWNGSTGGVDTRRFDYSKRQQWRTEIREELGILSDDFLLGFVGRITKDKGINEILEAFNDIQSEAKLLILGAPEGLDTLEPALWAEAQRNPNIYIHNSVFDIERYYAAIDVLLLPSHREGFGNVVIEAAAMGTPAIVSDIPGPIDAIKEGKTGIVFKLHDAMALKDAMITMKKNLSQYSKENCVEFIRKNFDDEILKEKILKQKKRYIE